MLKLNYSEAGLYMERLLVPLEKLVARRVVLATRLKQAIYIEPGSASFLLPANSPDLAQLKATLKQECPRKAKVIAVDDQFVEVNLRGTWVSESIGAHEGTFLTAVSDRAESLVYKLWQISQVSISSLAE